MLIKSERLIDSIHQSILEYNQNYIGVDESKLLPLIEFDFEENGVEISEETLKSLKNLSVRIIGKKIEYDEIEEATKELSEVLKIMNLDNFSINVSEKGNKPKNIDLSFFKHINNNVKYLNVYGVDCSNIDKKDIDRFKNLKHLSFRNCNIKNPKIFSDVNKDTTVVVEQKELDPNSYKDAIDLIVASEGKVKFSDPNLEKICNTYRRNEIKFDDYLKYVDIAKLDQIQDLQIDMLDDIEFKSEDLNKIIEIFNSKNNINLCINADNIEKLDKDLNLNSKVTLILKSAGEFESEKIDEHKCISNVKVFDYINNKNTTTSSPYTREEYIKIRDKIDDIISQIEMPDENDPNKQKKIFSNIYKILGKNISYDYDAISDEKRNDEQLRVTCRNLSGGLLENKCVCLGYADILRNVLSCVGIYAETIEAAKDWEKTGRFNIDSPDPGHAWNLVELDGVKYWTDLTWDANNIKADRYPLKFCLKSTNDFNHGIYVGRLKDEMSNPCRESISDEEQIELFIGRHLENVSNEAKQEAKNIGYLSDCALTIAGLGVSTDIMKKVAKEVNICNAIYKNNKIKEVEDGRY